MIRNSPATGGRPRSRENPFSKDEEGPALDEQLAQRRFRAGMTQEYRDWRAMARGNPEGLKSAGFKDNPNRGDKEELRLELELVY